MKKIDMSEEAVTQRLRQVDQLHELCLSLAKAKPISEDEAVGLRNRIRDEKRAMLSTAGVTGLGQNGK